MTKAAIRLTSASVAEDHPAAHSADTEWFAVDREGRVGRFDTLEDGTLPAAGGELNIPSVRQVAEANGHADLLGRLDDFDCPGEAQTELVMAELRSRRILERLDEA